MQSRVHSCTRKVLWWLFFSFCREEHGSISLLYRRSSRPSCNLSSLGRRSSGMSTQLLSPPLPNLLLLLFLFSSFSSPPILQTALLLHFSPNPFTLFHLPQSLSTLQLLQLCSLSQITLPPRCVPVLRRAYWACWNTQMFRLHWLQVGTWYRHLNDTSAQCCHDNIHFEAQFVLLCTNWRLRAKFKSLLRSTRIAWHKMVC